MTKVDVPGAGEGSRWRFPPFPPRPEGVEIVLFGDFRPGGIAIDPDTEGFEIDAYGIRTVALQKVHDTDRCLSESIFKPPPKPVTGGPARPRQPPWYDVWTGREPVDPIQCDDDYDRLVHAIESFERNRKFPQHVRELWDDFRRYLGVLKYNRPEEKAKNTEILGDEEDDDPDVEDMSKDAHLNEDVEVKTSGIEEVPGEPMDVVVERAFGERGKDMLVNFLENPEREIKIYLSHHMRKQGLIWNDSNLKDVPRIICFFLRSLEVNHVFQNPNSSASLVRAQAVTDVALKELPLTAALARALPDDFGMACQSLWGRKALFFFQFQQPHAEDKDVSPMEKVDTTDGTLVEGGGPKGIVEDATGTAETDAPDANTNPDASDSHANGWTGDDGWGKGDANGGWLEGNGSASWSDVEMNEDSSETDANRWAAPCTPTLWSLLGPTTFPLTHTTGIVETSLRRAKSIVLPPSTPAPSPDVVALLAAQLARVVLEPWGEYDEYNVPEIRQTSRGAVSLDRPAPGAPKPPSSSKKAHNPWTDEITLLVKPELSETVCVGMGIQGTWVQIVRESDVVAAAAGGDAAPTAEKTVAPTSKKKKSKSPPSYWYFEEMLMVLPSYYAEH
ncbi:hypothetical protein FISHEDRAFT_56575 [Fistulina hepatica ATCC 64428]|uniref:Uncharacterized protein n=1 Tax=Fistulina hepatica ATCC 64428 TaxID=1128425 RepID=A0A0D7AIS7_9AGAR|nr:hypothetical protein FISHEDRAFT_56575 [Fistulina hepatica ATCC 64428]